MIRELLLLFNRVNLAIALFWTAVACIVLAVSGVVVIGIAAIAGNSDASSGLLLIVQAWGPFALTAPVAAIASSLLVRQPAAAPKARLVALSIGSAERRQAVKDATCIF